MFRCQVVISNTQVSVLHEFAARWHGGIYRTWASTHNWRRLPCYAFRLHGRYALEFLSDIAPYVRIKRDTVMNAIAFCELKSQIVIGRRVDEGTAQQLLALIKKHKELRSQVTSEVDSRPTASGAILSSRRLGKAISTLL